MSEFRVDPGEGYTLQIEDELRKKIQELHANLEQWKDSSLTKANEDENAIQILNGKIRDLKNKLEHCNRAYAAERMKSKQNVEKEENDRMRAELVRLEYDFMIMKRDCQNRLAEAERKIKDLVV